MGYGTELSREMCTLAIEALAASHIRAPSFERILCTLADEVGPHPYCEVISRGGGVTIWDTANAAGTEY